MPMIIGINPVKKKTARKKSTAKRANTGTKKRRNTKRAPATKKTTAQTGAKRKGSTMAKRRRRRAPKTRTRTRTVKKVVYRSRPRRNPVRKSRRSNANPDTKMEFKKVLRGGLALAGGMVIAKMAVNKLTKGGSETERWSWANIGMAAGSAIAAALILKGIFSLKQSTTFFIAAGGVALSFYKIITTKIAPKWEISESWLGSDADINPALMGADDDYLLNDDIEVLDESGMGYLPGEAEAMGATNSGGQAVPYNPAMGATDSGGQVVNFNPAMGAVDNAFRAISARSEAAYPG